MFHDHVTNFIAAYNAHDAAAIAALIAPGGMHEGVPLDRVDTTPERCILITNTTVTQCSNQ
jgi:hypothetical protein